MILHTSVLFATVLFDGESFGDGGYDWRYISGAPWYGQIKSELIYYSPMRRSSLIYCSNCLMMIRDKRDAEECSLSFPTTIVRV